MDLSDIPTLYVFTEDLEFLKFAEPVCSIT